MSMPLEILAERLKAFGITGVSNAERLMALVCLAKMEAQQERIAALEAAIRKHRDQKGDDRCWMDDIDLYTVLPEGRTGPKRELCEPSEMLENCKRYIESRNQGTVYVSPQRKIEQQEAALKVAREALLMYADTYEALERAYYADVADKALAEIDRLRGGK